ncbi:hypothetical protein D3C86_927850 [compost metagenome]
MIEHEIAQVLGVGDAEVHQEIILATHVKQADHLGQRQYGIAKRIYDLPAVARQLQGDHGLDMTAQGLIIHLAVSALQHPVLLQLAHPLQAGGGSHPDQGRQILVGHARIAKQMGQDVQVQLIQVSHLYSFHRSIFLDSARKPGRTQRRLTSHPRPLCCAALKQGANKFV